MLGFTLVWVGLMACIIALFYTGWTFYSWFDSEHRSLHGLWRPGMMLFLSILLIGGLFIVQPQGEPTPIPTAQDEGLYQQTMEAPDEKPEEVLKEEAKEKVPDVLKRQDEGPEKDIEEANRMLDDMLKRRKK